MNRPMAGRYFRSWQFPATLVLVVVLALLYWAGPEKTVDVVSIDQANRWEQSIAPPRRKIVWGPVSELEIAAPSASESLIRPQLTDAGSSLYYSLQPVEGDAEIIVSRLRDGVWQPPK